MAIGSESKPMPLHTLQVHRRAWFNRGLALVYMCAIIGLVYHRLVLLFHSTNNLSFFLFLTMLISELVLAFMWATTEVFRLRPVKRHTFPERVAGKLDKSGFPALDVFVCTADPFKEPPIGVVNTALSAMAYDYPAGKISVYVSDDGGSELTLFAFMEAARFAKHWLPFSKQHGIEKRSPQAYFSGDFNGCPTQESKKMEIMYETMKERIERVVERGCVNKDEISCDQEREAFNNWTAEFNRQDHPTVIQVLLENGEDTDIYGNELPNLVYLAREKRRATPHQYKAGALNVLLRVSEAMSNAPLILTLDCDMNSNDPQAPLRALCYFLDPLIAPELGFVQFPQYFHGINRSDIYGCEHKRLFQINPIGMDGFSGPSYVGTGCFFSRKAFYGGPSQLSPSISLIHGEEINIVKTSFRSEEILEAAHRFSVCTYEQGSDWGSKMGFRYGSLVEDYFTGYILHCEGWRSVLCDPEKPAFLGEVPVSLDEVLSQNKRWSVGLLEVAFSKYCPLTYGFNRMSVLMGMSYAHYAFWPAWAIPITTYAVLPQLTLLSSISLFPKVSNPWFYLYAFLFLGAYIQDLMDFIFTGGTLKRWWSDQRMWMIRGVTSYFFAVIQFFLNECGISTIGFNITSKVIDDDQNKRYEQEIFQFGESSPFLMNLSLVSIINLISFARGLAVAIKQEGDLDKMFVQLFISGFVIINCWPIYEAMVFRRDKGKISRTTTIKSVSIAFTLCSMATLVLKSLWF